MGKPAARVGDLATPPHLPTALAPGIGSHNVLIGGKPAWRANIDIHVCATPIVPPAPAPHGPEICYLGSLSVVINSQMAVRMGDILTGAGPPNPIALGQPNVLIGDVGFGLADPNNMADFCRDFAELARNWSSLTTQERREWLEDITNRQLGRSGVPPHSVRGKSSLKPGNAEYDFGSDTLEISQSQLQSSTLTQSGARQLANAVYHEARHAEQWHLMARRAAGQGQSAAQIANNLGVTQSVATSAALNPLVGEGPQQNLAQASYDSVYGSRSSYREAVLDDDSRYAEYRALPEEQDAWNTGDTLPCG